MLLFVFRIIYRKRVYSCLQILVILLWRQLQQIPLIAVIVVVVNPVIDLCANILEGDTSGNFFADFVLHVSEEAFLWRVVPAVTTPGHRLNEFFIFQFLDEGITGVVASLIGMHDGLIIQCAAVLGNKLIYSSNDKVHFQAQTHAVSQDFMGERVKNRGQVTLTLRKEQIGELRQLVSMLGRTIQSQPLLSTDESNALFEVVTDYTYALDTLDNYDYERLTIEKTTKEEPFHATYENAMEEINRLRDKFGGSVLFGNEKDDSFKSSIGQIYQTFGGEELYPSVEEKAAMLLYLVTKNHSFSDGNKRIAATLFLWFLNNNHILYRKDGSKRLADNTLVALTLMIAESKTEEKDVMVKVVVNLINQRN